MERKYFTWNMSLLAPNHNCNKYINSEALTYTMIFLKCGIKTSSEDQEHYIVKNNLQSNQKILDPEGLLYKKEYTKHESVSQLQVRIKQLCQHHITNY